MADTPKSIGTIGGRGVMLAGILAAVAAMPNQEVRRLERGRSRSHRPKSNPPEVNALLDAKIRDAQDEERIARAEAKRRRKQIARSQFIHREVNDG